MLTIDECFSNSFTVFDRWQRQVTENITLQQSLDIIENAEKHGFVKATMLCSKCSTKVEPNAKFCNNCGVALTAAAQPSQPVLGTLTVHSSAAKAIFILLSWTMLFRSQNCYLLAGPKAAFLGGAAVDIKSAVNKAAAAEHQLGGRNPAMAALQAHQQARKPMIDLTK
jgi:hypothetical protein